MKHLGLFLVMMAILSAFAGGAFAASTITVRAGVHDRYNRLVFDWAEPVKYTMKQSAGRVMIQFNKPATADLKNVAYMNPPFIRNVQQENRPEGLFVSFEIPDDSRVQAFWSGQKVAFDVLRLSKQPPEFKKAEKEAQAAAEPAKIVQTTGPQTPRKEPEKKAAVAAPELKKETPPQRRGLQTLADILTGRKEEAVAVKSAAKQEPEKPKSETVITLTPEGLTRLALFERVGRLWLVIDRPEKELLPKVEGELAEHFKKVTRISLTEATAFVFDVPMDLDDVALSVRRSGPEWKVTVNPQDKPTLPAEMPIRVRDEDGNARQQPVVTLYAGEQPVVLNFKDSKMGDTLWVVPVRSPEGRVIVPRRTAGYFILPSYMGAVIAPRDDNLRIGTNDDLVVLSPASGHRLLISDMDDRKKGVILGAATPAFRLDVAALKDFAEEGFIARRRALENILLDEKTPAAKADRYVDMARVYLAQGFAAEAGGLLRIALRSNPALEKKQEFRALRGMAHALMGDLESATNDLRSDDLHSQPLSQLWMGYVFMQNKQPGLARDAFIESGSSDESLPPALQPRVLLARAESAMENGDMASAEFELKKIRDKSVLSPSEKAAYDYIRATVLMVTDDKNAGLEMYQKIAKGSDQLYRAKAEWQYIEQKTAAGELPLEKGIERLEGLRFAWRGDRMETNVLRTLGRLYAQNADYMNALAIWRQAASLSQDADDTDAITQDMQQTFRKLYVEGEADKIEPLRALAIFDRFRELTPAGEDGQVAHRYLAERLIAVDLLEQADALLENQVLKQAVGEEAVTLGTKLANIRLLNRNPSGAIKALQESERAEVENEKLRKRRVLLQARALADLGRINEALALLDDDQFPEGLSLKADINWREGRWPQAVVTLQKLIARYRNEGKGAVDGPMPPLILKMAIALALDDNRKGIELLAAEYGPFMDKTTQAEAFRLITKPSRGSSLADLQTLKNQVGEVELFEQFLKDFNS